MNGGPQTRVIPIQKAPSLTAFVNMAANSIQHHSALSGGIELRPAVVFGAGEKNILPDPEHLIDGIERVHLELIVGILAGDEDLEVVFFVDLRIPLGEGPPHIGLFDPESEIEILVVPEEGHASIKPGRLPGHDVDESG